MKQKNLTLKETFEIALQHYKKKDVKTAEALCNKILSIDQHHVNSTLLLATISAMNLEYKNAKKLLNKVADIEPNNLGVLNNLGTACKELEEYEDAQKYFYKVLAIDPDNTNANYNLGLVFYKLKDFQKAKVLFKKTVQVQSNFGFAFFCLANVHVDLKELDSAVKCYKEAIKVNPKILGAHNNLGLVYRKLNDFENAINCYKKAIEIKSDHAGTHHNLAIAFKELGRFNEAIESHEAAIKCEPDNLAHYFYLSDLKKGIFNSDLQKKVNSIITKNNSSMSNLAYGNYLLSKFENRLKNYEKEINYLIEGHSNYSKIKKEKFDLTNKYNFEDMLQISENAEIDNVNNDNYKTQPIFIIGTPRCGSTLVEKIIASGGKKIPIGEETTVLENYINEKILKNKSLNLGNVNVIRNEIDEIYKKKGLILDEYDHTFTDKSLNNFFYLRLIKDIYPNAKIINCKRDPLSSIVSIFQNHLSELTWTHNLENIFKYFDNYFNVMGKFSKIYPKIIYNLELDNLIRNPESESKSVMKFCELPWNIKCLEFYKRKDLISKTASNLQIRKAIYKHPIDKYIPYKKLLDKYGNKYSWFDTATL